MTVPFRHNRPRDHEGRRTRLRAVSGGNSGTPSTDGKLLTTRPRRQSKLACRSDARQPSRPRHSDGVQHRRRRPARLHPDRRHVPPLPDPRARRPSLHGDHGLLPPFGQRLARPDVLGGAPRRTTAARALELPTDGDERLLCEGEPDAPALALAAAVFVDGLDTGPVLEVCRDDHPKLRIFSMAGDIAMMTCHVCRHEPEFAMLAASAGQATGDRYRLPAKASRAWIVEHSEASKLGLVLIPADRLGGLSTHLRYEPDCDHDDCRCGQDETVRWNLEECVAVNIDPAELYG